MIFLYVPFDTPLNAKTLATEALEQKLAACVNIFPAIDSLYMWPDKDGVERLCEEREAVALFKTTLQQKEKLIDLITAKHLYETPAIISFECTANPAFEKWVIRQTIPLSIIRT